jgi:hypothetical protein
MKVEDLSRLVSGAVIFYTLFHDKMARIISILRNKKQAYFV